MLKDDMLEVALLGKTIGLKGAIKLHNRSDFPSQFKKGAKFYLTDGEILEILSFNKTNFVAVFKNYENIECAAKLTNKILYQSKEITKKTCKLGKDEFFYFEILGLEVFENEEKLGKVADIFEAGNFVFEIATDEKLIKKGFHKIFYLPYTDHFIDKISIEEGKIFSRFGFEILQNS